MALVLRSEKGLEIEAWPYNPLKFYTWLGPVLGILLIRSLLWLELPVMATVVAILGVGVAGTMPFFPRAPETLYPAHLLCFACPRVLRPPKKGLALCAHGWLSRVRHASLPSGAF